MKYRWRLKNKKSIYGKGLWSVSYTHLNGSSYEKLQEKVSILSFENAQIREEVQQAVRQIFENVPVFEYKGYSRAEYKRLSYQKQLKKRKNLFTIIDGGKE